MNTIIDFLSFRKQRVVLNKKVSKWTSIEAGVSQGSILGPLLFLIYINNLSDDLSTNAKLFADNTSLFSIVRDINAFNLDLSSGGHFLPQIPKNKSSVSLLQQQSNWASLISKTFGNDFRHQIKFSRAH